MAPRGRGRPYQGRSEPDDAVDDSPDEETLEETQRAGDTRILYGLTSEHFSDPQATRLVTYLFKARWIQPWAYWKEVPSDERERLWKQFISHYTYSEEHLPLIRRTWEATLQRRITGTLNQLWEKAHKLSKSDDVTKWRGFCPSFMHPDVWNRLLERTSSEEFKQHSQAARKNRLTLKEGEVTKHTAGSIPFTTHKERMTSSDGRTPNQLEVFKKTHMKKSTESYIDARSQKFVAAGDSGKGRVYGFTPGDSPGILSRAPSQSRRSCGVHIWDDTAFGEQSTQGNQEMLSGGGYSLASDD